MKVGIFTFYMSNIDPRTVSLHRAVVEKFNPCDYTHRSIYTSLSHADALDRVWMSYPGLDVVMFLDVDCVPLHQSSLALLYVFADIGFLIGNAQRSNHIQNDQHVFVAPSAVAISDRTFNLLQRPSAQPTFRGDVLEEYTYQAEAVGVPIKLLMPLGFEEAPAEAPSWPLADGMPHFGRGTTYGLGDSPMFWHGFQSFHPGRQEKLQAKYEALLA